MSESTPTPATSYLDLIRNNANFRNLWLGEIVSLLGDWFNLIASAALVTQLTDTKTAIGTLFVIRMLAPFMISPFAGVWADRYNRRNILIVTDLLRAITLFGFLLVREPEHVWLLYALTAFQMALSGVFFPARRAILPDIVDRHEIGAANALSSATWSIMLAFGAALGGISTGLLGIYPSFIIDAFTFFLSAYFILRVSYTHISSSKASDSSMLVYIQQFLDGLRYLKNNLDIFVISLLKPAQSLLVSGGVMVVQVIISQEIFVIGEGGGNSLGWIFAFVGVGTGIGPIIARRFTGDRPKSLRKAIALSFFISAFGLYIISLLTNFSVVLLGSLLRGIGIGLNWVFTTQLLLHYVPDRMRGRVFSSEFAFLTLMSATGSAFGSWMLDNTGLDIVGLLRWSAGLLLLPGILWILWVRYGRHTEELSS